MSGFFLNAFLANRARYEAGELAGERVSFPAGTEELRRVLRRIGLEDAASGGGESARRILVTGFHSDIPALDARLSPDEDVEKLSLLAAGLRELSDGDYARYRAVLEEGREIPEAGIDGLINLRFNLDRYEDLPAARNAGGITLRTMTGTERLYVYPQSAQIEAQTGLIGVLRGDMGPDGNGFFTSWTDRREDLKTEAFRKDLDAVIGALRTDAAFGGLLKSRTDLLRCGRAHPDSAFTREPDTDFGFRADTERYSFLLRVNGRRGDYNLYAYAYYRPWLEQHMDRAKSGIRFVTADYEEKFRIPDGGKVRVTDRDGAQRESVCRFVDEYHLETDGHALWHIGEYAEMLERNERSVEPLTAFPDRDAAGRMAPWRREFDGSRDRIPAEYRLPERGKEPEEITVLVVEPKKEPYAKTIPAGLESLQREVGGSIEAVYPFGDAAALIVNEEGKLEGLPLNRALYSPEGRLWDITAGTMLVAGLGEESFVSLSPAQLEEYGRLYRQPEMFIRINREMRVFPVVPEGKEEADRIAADLARLFARSGPEGALPAVAEAEARTEEAYSVILRSGEDYALRRSLLSLAEREGENGARARELLDGIDRFYERQQTPRYLLYQVKFEGNNIFDRAFRPYRDLCADGFRAEPDQYACVYSGRLAPGQTPDDLYERFNFARPADFLGHMLSVSDVIVMKRDGQSRAYYVDSVGFQEVPEFLEDKARQTQRGDAGRTESPGEERKVSLASRLREKREEAALRVRPVPVRQRAAERG